MQRAQDAPFGAHVPAVGATAGTAAQAGRSESLADESPLQPSATARRTATAPASERLYTDSERRGPGREPWQPVPNEQVQQVCGLDPVLLAQADRTLGKAWAVIRYGKLCHSYLATDMAPMESLSATKFLGATVTGAVALRTADLPRTGPKTGPLSDEDRVDAWIDRVGYNPEAHIAHVLAMVAQSPDLSYGRRTMEYDYFGFVQLDSLNFILNAALRQPGARLGRNLDEFSKRFVFEPLGMVDSTWSLGLSNKSFGFGWSTTVLDMARLGLMVLDRGSWDGTQIISAEWAYRMTHPALEDANTAMGYCTWLNSKANFHTGTMPTPESWTDLTAEPRFPGPCAPAAVYRQHPHGLSAAPDCNYAPDHDCDQMFDVGVWQTIAGFGSVIQGHPGLDMVLVAFQLTPDDFFGMGAAGILWDAVRPAVVAADPQFASDEAAFCEAYGANRYAPDLREATTP